MAATAEGRGDDEGRSCFKITLLVLTTIIKTYNIVYEHCCNIVVKENYTEVVCGVSYATLKSMYPTGYTVQLGANNIFSIVFQIWI